MKLQMKNCNLQITMFPILQVIKHMQVLHKLQIASYKIATLQVCKFASYKIK
jgi:hypothetical protein